MRAFCFGRRVCHLSSVCPTSDLGNYVRYARNFITHEKSESESKNMMSYFALEVAKYPQNLTCWIRPGMDRASLSQRSGVSNLRVLKLFATTVHYWYLILLLFMAFHLLSLLHFPPLLSTPTFSTSAFSTPAFSAPPKIDIILGCVVLFGCCFLCYLFFVL